MENQKVRISIEDTGTGIKDLDAAFTLGCRRGAESPLNEHGFGLKHALASADPSNSCWSISTRTADDLKNNRFKKISAPYSFEQFCAESLDTAQWTGAYSGTGTIVTFECSYDMYKTLSKGMNEKGIIGRPVEGFEKIAALLYEDIGFVYAGIILNGKASISLKIVSSNNKSSNRIHSVGAITPDFQSWIHPGKGNQEVNLGDGIVNIQYQFGISAAKDDNKDYEFVNTKTRRYYKNTMTSSGVEIRLNGRVICYNLFKEIWGIEKHNSFNSFLVILDLISNNSKALPKTRTSKNGLREGDPHLEKLFEWIKKKVPKPIKDSNYADHEIDLFNLLCENKNKYNPDPNKTISTERTVFNNTGSDKDKVRIDLFEDTMGQLTIYEGKKDITTSKDVYQLRMYWDGLVYEGINPTTGVLVSAYHPQSVYDMVAIVNTMKDYNGNNYNFICKTWKDLEIQYGN